MAHTGPRLISFLRQVPGVELGDVLQLAQEAQLDLELVDHRVTMQRDPDTQRFQFNIDGKSLLELSHERGVWIVENQHSYERAPTPRHAVRSILQYLSRQLRLTDLR